MNEIKISDSIIIHAEDGIDSDYFKIIRDIYEKIPLQYGNEKRLFEQFAEYVCLLPKNENNPIGESRGRFRFADKRIIIDIPFDMNSRKPGSIFIHEFGHLVTDTMGLYRDGLPLGKYKKFCNRLVKECEKYSAFANIFCCKVLGLEEELAAMKRIFPESYQLYEEMVANIISNPKKNFGSWLDNKAVLIMITLLSPMVGLTLICMKTRK